MSRLTIHTLDSAPEGAKERLETAKKNNGFLPNLIGVLANAPTALETYQVVGGINAKTGLTPQEREVVQITAATLNGCGFCVAGHTALARKKLGMPEEVVQALRNTEALNDTKLNALAQFTIAVMEQRQCFRRRPENILRSRLFRSECTRGRPGREFGYVVQLRQQPGAHTH
jgi:uncharacterized peroxidase-related enzyme